MASRGRTLLISGHNSIGNYKCRRRRRGGRNEISREEDEGHAATAGDGNGDLVLLPHSGRRLRPANDGDCSGGGRQKANGA